MTMIDSRATVLLSAGIAGIYGLERAGDGQALCETYGLVPAHATLGTAFSSLFLHDPAGWAHIGGNLAFLVVFGVIVEQALGSFRFLALFAAAGLGGAALHIFLDPSSTTALVGCSGALYGLMAVACGLRPRLLGFAVGFVGFNIWMALTGTSGSVSSGAHIGGFFVGVVVVACMKIFGDEALEEA